MPKRRTLLLTDEQRLELDQVRNQHEKAHMREKAAVLIKIADSMSPHAAAMHGGLKSHHPDTIYKWMDWYEAEGIQRLEIQPGRGRKPAFSP
jgi:transposase